MKKNKNCTHKVTYYDARINKFKCQFCPMSFGEVKELKPYTGKIVKSEEVKEKTSTITDNLLDKKIKERLFENQTHCQCCGETDQDKLDPAHIMSRKYKNLRWDLQNLVSLCRPCHTDFTVNPLKWKEWWTKKYPDRVEYLEKKLGVIEKVDNQVVFNYINKL